MWQLVASFRRNSQKSHNALHGFRCIRTVNRQNSYLRRSSGIRTGYSPASHLGCQHIGRQ